VDLPLSGEAATLGRPVMQGIQMAVDDLTAAGTPAGGKLRIVALDDAADRVRAAANARAIVDDATAIAMVGPWGSAETFPVIPVTNDARLLQCGPSSTHPGLTKPRYGALDLRSAHPDIVTFVRIAPSDDIQSVALAAFAYDDLAAHRALVVDDTGDGRAIADAFEAGFTELGGTTVRRALNPDAAPRSVLAPFADELDAPRVVFFGGDPTRGAALRVAMAEAGRLSTPFLSWDALLYPSPGDPSYLQLVGAAAAAGSYVAHASLPDQKFSWADAYRHRFGSQPDEYAAAGYACVEIVAEALDAALAAGSGADVRESVRAYVIDPSHRYETVLGTVAFDQNGDAIRQFVTFYRVDPSGAGGAGEWVIAKKQDFGPAP
jgi:branched-chain amino acid transport system substrate-binding protein